MVKMTKVCKDIQIYLKAEYRRKGYNFLFNARKVNIPKYSTHLKGSALGKMQKTGSIVKWGSKDSSPMLYKTRFSK